MSENGYTLFFFISFQKIIQFYNPQCKRKTFNLYYIFFHKPVFGLNEFNNPNHSRPIKNNFEVFNLVFY